MLLGDQHYRQGGVVVQQVEEGDPADLGQLHGGAGHGVIAVKPLAPGDVLIAEYLTGPEAEAVAARINQLNEALQHAKDGNGPLTTGKDLGARGIGEPFTVHLGGNQINRRCQAQRCGQSPTLTYRFIETSITAGWT